MSEILAGVVTKSRAALTDGTDLLLVIAGAGSSAALVEVIRSWIPEQTEGMADETVVAIAGFIMFYYGNRIHERLTAFGFGVFIAGVGAWSSEWVAGIIGMLAKKEGA